MVQIILWMSLNDCHNHFYLAAGYTKVVNQYRLMTMKINKLTIVACSGSILAATLFGTPSQGMPLQSVKIGEGQSVKIGEGQSVSLADRNGNRENIRQPKEQGQSLPSASYQSQLQQAVCTKLSCGCLSCVTAH
jgi:hypothetical protein